MTAAALYGVACAPASALGRDALRTVVNTLCVPAQQTLGLTGPCERVVLEGGVARGYVLLHAPFAATHLLLVPTAPISGIEDTALQRADAPNYFLDAWRARGLVAARAARPLVADEIGLAVNARTGRSQDQLHIHVDCIDAGVRDTLRAKASAIGPHWSRFPGLLAGRAYDILRVDSLPGTNPFAVLAGLPGARGDMAARSLAVLGATLANGREGFYLLSGRTDARGRTSSSEALLDHSCKAQAANR